MEPHYFIDKRECPWREHCCGQGPVIILACPACGTLISCCGEADFIVGTYRGPREEDMEATSHEDNNEHQCPACQGKLEWWPYATKEQLKAIGFTPDLLLEYVGAPRYFVDCKDCEDW